MSENTHHLAQQIVARYQQRKAAQDAQAELS
jgi:hypothetical protein